MKHSGPKHWKITRKRFPSGNLQFQFRCSLSVFGLIRAVFSSQWVLHRTSKREDTLDQRQEMFFHLDLLMKDYSQLKDNKSLGGFGLQVFTKTTWFEMSTRICAWVLSHLQHSINLTSHTAWCQRTCMCVIKIISTKTRTRLRNVFALSLYWNYCLQQIIISSYKHNETLLLLTAIIMCYRHFGTYLGVNLCPFVYIIFLIQNHLQPIFWGWKNLLMETVDYFWNPRAKIDSLDIYNVKKYLYFK